MSEEEEDKSQAGRWIIGVVAALVLYVLSYGPVYAFVKKHIKSGSGEEVVASIYAPLSWFAVNTPLGVPMASYCNWWCAVFDVPVYFNYGPRERD